MTAIVIDSGKGDHITIPIIRKFVPIFEKAEFSPGKTAYREAPTMTVKTRDKILHHARPLLWPTITK
jgi:hypothetical protein